MFVFRLKRVTNNKIQWGTLPCWLEKFHLVDPVRKEVLNEIGQSALRGSFIISYFQVVLYTLQIRYTLLVDVVFEYLLLK